MKGFRQKFNSSMGAWVCNNCDTIVETGYNTPPKKKECNNCKNKYEDEK